MKKLVHASTSSKSEFYLPFSMEGENIPVGSEG